MHAVMTSTLSILTLHRGRGGGGMWSSNHRPTTDKHQTVSERPAIDRRVTQGDSAARADWVMPPGVCCAPGIS